eukprot:scaffold2576_cov418-Prasinococcus_capsulatus_cf.AAC.4
MADRHRRVHKWGVSEWILCEIIQLCGPVGMGSGSPMTRPTGLRRATRHAPHYATATSTSLATCSTGGLDKRAW